MEFMNRGMDPTSIAFMLEEDGAAVCGLLIAGARSWCREALGIGFKHHGVHEARHGPSIAVMLEDGAAVCGLLIAGARFRCQEALHMLWSLTETVAACKLTETCTFVLAAACEAASGCVSGLRHLSQDMPEHVLCAASVIACANGSVSCSRGRKANHTL